MNENNLSKPRALLATCCVALFSALPGEGLAQVAFFDPQEGLNTLALSAGSALDFIGSGDNAGAIGPVARYHFSGKRYVQILGPQLSVNLLNDDVWQFGPQLLLRFERDSDVEDPVVKNMRPIDSALEAGVFLAAHWKLGDDPRHRFGVRADAQVGENGYEGTLTANYFLPVARAVVLNVGGGMGLTNDKWARAYFGVEGSDVALFPSLGGNSYKAQGGVHDVRFNLSALVPLSPNWHLGVGAHHQKLQGDAADSPMVRERGSSDSLIYGAAVAYV